MLAAPNISPQAASLRLGSAAAFAMIAARASISRMSRRSLYAACYFGIFELRYVLAKYRKPIY
ncbi:MAG TPA: hypothetical protein VKS22_12185 [Candidatus Binataceae bacterium]|nr:hypothetical protein [Candidatus Binataceae bacterium]